MAHETETLEKLDIRTIQDRIYGWVLAQDCHARITAERVMFELQMTESQALIGLAKALEDDVIVRSQPETWARAWIPF